MKKIVWDKSHSWKIIKNYINGELDSFEFKGITYFSVSVMGYAIMNDYDDCCGSCPLVRKCEASNPIQEACNEFNIDMSNLAIRYSSEKDYKPFIYSEEDLDNLPEIEKEFIKEYKGINCFKCQMKPYKVVRSLIKNKYSYEYDLDEELINILKQLEKKEILMHKLGGNFIAKGHCIICGDAEIEFEEDMFKNIRRIFCNF